MKSIRKYLWPIAPLLLLCGCVGMPRPDKIADLYQAKYPDRHVILVEERESYAEGAEKALYVTSESADIYYRDSKGEEHKDIWHYHAVAEGWIRDDR